MDNILIKYIKDENNQIISPVTSTDSIFSPQGGGIQDYVGNLMYPVGSIYLSINSTNPNVLFGGTWEQLKDRFLLGVGDTYKTVGATGGEATHTLTTDEMPSHTHIQNSHSHTGVYNGTNSTYGAKSDGDAKLKGQIVLTTSSKSTGGTTATNQNTGGGQAHNNMPPYLTVYMWKRIA